MSQTNSSIIGRGLVTAGLVGMAYNTYLRATRDANVKFAAETAALNNMRINLPLQPPPPQMMYSKDEAVSKALHDGFEIENTSLWNKKNNYERVQPNRGFDIGSTCTITGLGFLNAFSKK